MHFFWGSFDLAVTRFSGRPAAPPEGADPITRGGYDAELSSLGFWPGGRGIRGTTDGAAFYSGELSEFLLMYRDVRAASDPRAAILELAQTTYEAAARLQEWPMDKLELRVKEVKER